MLAWSLYAVVQTVGVGLHAAGQHRAAVAAYAGGYALLAGGIDALASHVARGASERARRWAVGGVAVAAIAAGPVVVGPELLGLAARIAERIRLPYALLAPVLGALAGAIVPLFALAGRLVAGRGRVAPIAWAIACLAGVGANDAVLPFGYDALHLVAALALGLGLSAGLVGLRVPERIAPVRPERAGLVAALVLLAVGTPSIVLTPSHAVLVHLGRRPAAVLARYPLFPPDRAEIPVEPPAAWAPWFAVRDAAPDVPASATRLAPKRPIVVLLGIDSLRADVLADDANRALLPTLFRLRDESAYFTEARGPGTSTAITLSSMFSGRYYSQLYWSPYLKRPPDPFPHLDESVRFPDLLRRAGYHSVTADVSEWLTGDYGIVRGFDEELVTKRAKNHYRPAREALKPLYSSLKAHGAGPMFVFSHLLDAHAPHNFGRKDGTVYERYLSELEVVDRAVGELVKELERRKLWDRTCFLLYSDHGEGFGEHQSTFHGYGLYDELQHVPLLVRIPGLAPQRIDQRVSLIDVGPTILDLAGLPTPGSYMGQSLVPLLAGSRDELARPMFSEARLKHGLVLPDGRKLIHDTRLRSVELYDLNRDPGELHNLYDDDDPEHVRLLSLVKRFFAVHTLKRPGYRVPFRRW